MIETFSFIPAEQRERTKRFDAVVETTKRAISTIALAQTLPSEMLNGFKERVDGFFVPNVSDNVIDIPQGYEHSDHTPLLIVDGDETLFLGKSFVDQVDQQIDRAVTEYPSHGFYDIDRDYHVDLLARARLYDSNSPAPLRALGPKIGAGTDWRYWSIINPQGAEISLSGRPIIRFRDQIDSIAQASFLKHEDEHVVQQHGTAFYDATKEKDKSLRAELEAYYKQRLFDLALIGADFGQYYEINDVTESAERADLVDLNPSDDPFAPSEAVKQAAKDNNILLN